MVRASSCSALAPTRRTYTPDSLLCESAGVLRTHAWLERCHRLRECLCQKVRYHAGERVPFETYLRVLAQLDEHSAPLTFPEILLTALVEQLPPRPIRTREREAVERRQRGLLDMPADTSGLLIHVVESDFVLRLHDRGVWASQVRLTQLPENRSIVRLCSARPYLHSYSESFLEAV